MAWSRRDFVMFNGTNVFHYAEGRPLEFPATRRRSHPARLEGGHRECGRRRAPHVPRGQLPRPRGHAVLRRVASTTTAWQSRARPTGSPAIRPARSRGEARTGFWAEIGKMVPPMSAVFQETPWENYTTFLIFDSTFGGGSALEHQNSHVGIYGVQAIGNPLLASITAHEIFHAWNVKRLRPAEMVPVPLRPLAAHAMALGERGNHRLLRRSRAGAGRHRGLDGVLRAHRGEGAARWRRRRPPRWRTSRSRPGSIRWTGATACTIPRARWPAC